MTQTLPLSLTLGSANAGKLIGYTVLALDRTEYAVFALATESAVAGTYYALGGYAAPDAGGYLVVSESDGGDPAVLTAMVETDIEPSSANVTLWKGATAPNMTGDSFARLGAPAGASIAADIAAISAGGATADELWDEVVDGTYTARQLLRLLASSLVGKSTGGGTTGVAFRDLADTKNRIAATVDADGNRTAVTLIAT